jgi:hypothetical protein
MNGERLTKGVNGMRYAANATKFSRFICFAAVLLLSLETMAFAAEETYAIDSKGDSTRVFRVMTDGKRVEIEGAGVGASDADASIYWLHVDGGENGRKEMTGSKSGIYFFDNKDKPLYFLPYEGEVNDVSFSPDRKYILVVKSGMILSELTLFAFGDTKKKMWFESLSEPYWFDANRFAFAVVEPGKDPRPLPDDSADGEDFDGWSSIVICDGEVNITWLLEATETKNYMLGGADMDEKKFTIYETTVKDKKDWADTEKQEVEELTVPFPGK